MQTESSLAKVSAGSKDSLAESSSSRGSLGKKESYTMVRFPSTPDIAADAQEADRNVECVKNLPWPFSGSGGADSGRGVLTDSHIVADSGVGVAALKSQANDVSLPTDADDRALMPPPLSSSVPLSYQANFVAKAAKHRRTTMPESLSRSRELLAGAIAKHRLSDLSASDGDDSPPSSRKSDKVLQPTQDTSPIEPPQRDFNKTQSRLAGAPPADVSLHTACSDTKADYGDVVSSAECLQTGSPKKVKLGRCVSPLRPLSSSNTSPRRQLPADPRLAVSGHGSSDHSTLTVSVASQLPVPRSVSDGSGISLVQPTHDSAVSAPMQRGLTAQPAGGQRLVASKTETRLVLNLKDRNGAQQSVVTDTERSCMLTDGLSQDAVAADQPNKPVITPRQQWEKAAHIKPFVHESLSNSSVSQTASSSVCGDSLVLADVSSLSRNSVNSVSSSSCLALHPHAVVTSVSDSVISYGSMVQVPMSSAAAANVAGADSEVIKSNAASDGKVKLQSGDTSEQPISAISSDK